VFNVKQIYNKKILFIIYNMSSVDGYFKLLKEEEVITKRLNEIKKEKIYICKKVWKECQHKWERCSFDDDDLCKYRCKKCTLYNNDYFYT